MSRWLVTHGESQFSAKDLAELKQMASDGRVQPADLIQPPGASDWLYALELPELKDTFPTGITDEDDDSLYGKKKNAPSPSRSGCADGGHRSRHSSDAALQECHGPVVGSRCGFR